MNFYEYAIDSNTGKIRTEITSASDKGGLIVPDRRLPISNRFWIPCKTFPYIETSGDTNYIISLDPLSEQEIRDLIVQQIIEHDRKPLEDSLRKIDERISLFKGEASPVL